MIYTCTLNPAIDYKIKIDQLNLNELNRFKDGKFYVGGKGINVSIGLKHLGTSSIVTGFLGGLTGNHIKEEIHKNHKLGTKFIMTNTLTRVNVKVLIADKETEINHDGEPIESIYIDRLLNLVNNLKSSDLLVCGGSTAKGHPNLYEKIAKICYSHQVPFIMDTPGNYIDQFIQYHPLLMKPNLFELETYLGKSLDTRDEKIKACQYLIEKGAINVILSLGSQGSLFVNKDIILEAPHIDKKVNNTVGAGDSMVAGFTHAYKAKQSILNCYKSAVAGASATTFGRYLLDELMYQEILTSITIKEIK